jgi:hypothetical protein
VLFLAVDEVGQEACIICVERGISLQQFGLSLDRVDRPTTNGLSSHTITG